MEQGLIEFGETRKSEDVMTSLELASVIGKQHKDVLKAIRNMEAAWEKVCGRKFALTSRNIPMPNGGFRTEVYYELTKRESLYIATKFKDEERARLVLRWEYLETDRRKHENTSVETKMRAALWACDFLKLNDVSRLMMARSILEPLGLPVPDYVQSKGVHHSAKELLKNNNVGVTSQYFNKRALAAGILCVKTRKSKKGEKAFYVITDKGMQYGENLVSDHNPNETQPHWYDDSFKELLCEIGIISQQNMFQ